MATYKTVFQINGNPEFLADIPGTDDLSHLGQWTFNNHLNYYQLYLSAPHKDKCNLLQVRWEPLQRSLYKEIQKTEGTHNFKIITMLTITTKKLQS